jgi:protein disulfide-isomerase A6
VSKNFEDESSVCSSDAYSNTPSITDCLTQCIIADFNADAAENRPLAQEYGVSSYPTIKFFPKGEDKTPVSYEQGRSETDFINFLNKHCGTHRAVGGGLNDLVGLLTSVDCLTSLIALFIQAGRVASLDSLAAQFFTALPTSRSSVLEEASAVGATLGDSASYYLKVMQKVVNGTEDYVEKEAKR